MTTPVRASFHPSTVSTPAQSAKRPVTAGHGKPGVKPVRRAGQQLPTTVMKRISLDQRTASKLPTTAQAIKPPTPHAPAIATILPAVKSVEKLVDKKKQANTTIYRALMAATGAVCLATVCLAYRPTARLTSRGGGDGSGVSHDSPTSSSSQSDPPTQWWPFGGSSFSQSQSSRTLSHSSQADPSNTNTSYPCNKTVTFVPPYRKYDGDVYHATFAGSCLDDELISGVGSLSCIDYDHRRDPLCIANGTFLWETTSVKSVGFFEFLSEFFFETPKATIVWLQDGNYIKNSYFDIHDIPEVKATVKNFQCINTTVKTNFPERLLTGNFDGNRLINGQVYEGRILHTEGDYVYNSSEARALHGEGTSCGIDEWPYGCWKGNHHNGLKEGNGTLFLLGEDSTRKECGWRNYDNDQYASGLNDNDFYYGCEIKEFNDKQWEVVRKKHSW